jgi:hypothetical protein
MALRPDTRPRLEPGDVLFPLFLAAYATLSISLIPFDFTDLCYLFSLEHGNWVTQEWVHPIYVPALRLLRIGLGVFGFHGHMLVPVEVLNVAASTTAFALLYSLARRVPHCSLAAAVALGATALCTGFWLATLRSTPYALALLCQTIALMLLISDRPVRPRRYALAGVLAGLAMGLHASAMALAGVGVLCALFEPDPARTRLATRNRILAFGSALLAVALFDWTVFLAYNHIGLDYFHRQDFGSAWAGIEQVPGRSVYTNDSLATQLADFVESMRSQVGALVLLAAVTVPLALVLRRWRGVVSTPFERRLAIAAAANFAGIAGFFVINGSHNGFIFASMTLVPVVLAESLRGSWIGLAALLLLATPASRENIGRMVRAGAQGANDPQLVEVHFLGAALAPRDVLLTPGSPFPEMLYLAHLNIFEVSASASTLPSSEVPVVHPGPTLCARIAWWLAHGARVFYARGDDSTDFAGDLGGAEKEHQIFWRPETAARERAPALQQLRGALEAAGLDLRDRLISPRGERYAEIGLRAAPAAAGSSPPAQPPITAGDLDALVASSEMDTDDPQFPRRAQFLAELEAALPGDPWLACDVMNLVCKDRPEGDGQRGQCQPVVGCDAIDQQSPEARQPGGGRPSVGGETRGCFWAPISDRRTLDEYLRQWVRSHDLGALSDWGFEADGSSAEMTMVLSAGTLTLDWQLSGSCAADRITSHGLAADALPTNQLSDLVEGLPVPKVHPGPEHT